MNSIAVSSVHGPFVVVQAVAGQGVEADGYDQGAAGKVIQKRGYEDRIVAGVAEIESPSDTLQ